MRDDKKTRQLGRGVLYGRSTGGKGKRDTSYNDERNKPSEHFEDEEVYEKYLETSLRVSITLYP